MVRFDACWVAVKAAVEYFAEHMKVGVSLTPDCGVEMSCTSAREAGREAMMRPGDRKLARGLVEPSQTETSSPRRFWCNRRETHVTPDEA